MALPRPRPHRPPAGWSAAVSLALALAVLPVRVQAQTVTPPQEFDLQQFKAAPGEGALLSLHGTRSLAHLQVQAGLLINFGSAPLVLRTATTGAVSSAVVAHQTTAELIAAVGLFDWAE